MQSLLEPHGPGAALAAEMAWVLIVGGAAVFLLVMGLAAWAAFARRESAARLGREGVVVAGGIVFPAVVVTALLVYGVARMAGPDAGGAPAVRIEVVGEQWWWRVHYLDAAGARDFATANEIRIPAGRPVELVLRSADVIHSFWVPSLAGKLDMLPGKSQALRLRADRAGEYRGQCAEYCGGPHGLMAFYVVAEPPGDFARWAEGQRREAAGGEARGASLFAARCAACHTVRGTGAAGTLGPDLTHVGSRRTIGAGLLPNNAGALAAWIASSQHLKPGNLMPSFGMLAAEDLAALAAYLSGLR